MRPPRTGTCAFARSPGRTSLAKVAVVGGGAAGIGAAIALTRSGMDVALFEAEARLGGHCYAVAVSQWDGRTIRVDAGVSEYNPATAGSFAALLRELDLRTQPVNADISVMTPQRVPVWHCATARRCFAALRTIRSGFSTRSRASIAAASRCSTTRPMRPRQRSAISTTSSIRRIFARSISIRWRVRPCDARQLPGEHPIRSLVTSWRMLGLVGPDAQRMTLQGGMHSWCDAAERWLRTRNVQLFLSTRVASISRLGDSVRLRAVDGEKSSRHFAFDHVIIATSPRAGGRLCWKTPPRTRPGSTPSSNRGASARSCISIRRCCRPTGPPGEPASTSRMVRRRRPDPHALRQPAPELARLGARRLRHDQSDHRAGHGQDPVRPPFRPSGDRRGGRAGPAPARRHAGATPHLVLRRLPARALRA